MLDAVFDHDLVGLALLVEDMGLHLVDHRRDLHKATQVDEPVGVEVGHADGPRLAGLVGFLHGAPGAVIIVERLVDQQKVHIVAAQVFQRLVDGGFGLLIPAVGDPDFGGQKQLAAGHTAGGDGCAHRILIVVGLGSVDGTVTDTDGVLHTTLTFLVRDLVDAWGILTPLDKVTYSMRNPPCMTAFSG